MIEVVLRAVRVDVGSATPLLLLEEVAGDRVLPIYIGAPEATAIAYALQQIETPRPMTHDLIADVTTALGAKVFCAEVTALREGTFYAALRLVQATREIEVDCRPSDAIATALRVGAPILVADELMNEYGREMDLSDEVDEDEEALDPDVLLEEMRAFLDDVRPEDFEA